MDLTQLFLDFIRQNGLATGIIVFGAWFLVSKVWPWYTGTYLPAATARQDSRDKVIVELRDAILELKTMTIQLVGALQQHDSTTHELVMTLVRNQQSMLDLLPERHTPPPSQN